MNIKEIALKIWPEVCKSSSVGETVAVKFAEALIAEVQKQNVAVYQIRPDGDNWIDCTKVFYDEWRDPESKRILFSSPPSIEAEREKVAEACAKYLHDLHERSTKHHNYYLCAALEIEEGEWRRFVK